MLNVSKIIKNFIPSVFHFFFILIITTTAPCVVEVPYMAELAYDHAWDDDYSGRCDMMRLT